MKRNSLTGSFRRVYRVRFIHKTFDWDADIVLPAADAKDARRRAPGKLAYPREWLIVSARMEETTS